MGKLNTCCGYGADGTGENFDCVQIPSASKEADMAIIAAAGFCGTKLVSAEGDTVKSVCCKLTLCCMFIK